MVQELNTSLRKIGRHKFPGQLQRPFAVQKMRETDSLFKRLQGPDVFDLNSIMDIALARLKYWVSLYLGIK